MASDLGKPVIRGSDGRLSANTVDYTELPGAKKDADCRHVQVPDGVSTQLGCCNDFEYEEGNPKQFRCGTCEYVLKSKPDNFFGA
jgi:hypothetical protein